MVQEESCRKGPWTEQEDLQLVCFVGLFGDRRWDFIANVSGLKRTGKSCRLRWVNYLHPGLKRGKMTPHEKKLVLELHSQFGNRWSRIARKLPGRTDNEIKNYWRTHMRKKAQQKKPNTSSPCVSNCSSSSSNNNDANSSDYKVAVEKTATTTTTTTGNTFCLQDMEISEEEVYSMDEIWKDISSSEEAIKPMCSQQAVIASPIWDYCPDDSLWNIDDEETKMFNFPFTDAFLHC
ncbi:hypothetical protein V2J09_007419 [Rumex salicifolius]